MLLIDSRFHTAQGATRWLISDGVISVAANQCFPLLIEGALWGVALAGAIVAIASICRTGLRNAALFYGLALSALAIGYAGLLPLPFCPRIFYCQTDGDAQFAFELNRLFAAPLLLGASACAAAVLGNVNCPMCQQPAIPFHQFWLQSPRQLIHCPHCGSTCRVRHPLGFVLIGIPAAVTVMALGHFVAGTSGILASVPIAVGAGAWVSCYALQSLRLLAASTDLQRATKDTLRNIV